MFDSVRKFLSELMNNFIAFTCTYLLECPPPGKRWSLFEHRTFDVYYKGKVENIVCTDVGTHWQIRTSTNPELIGKQFYPARGTTK